MGPLTQVEHQCNFRLPPAYRAFAERGYLTYPGPSYLCAHDAEWIPPASLPAPETFFGNPKPGLVPFAFTGGHDLWCWQTQRTTSTGEPAVVQCPRDSHVGAWYTPSFIGWLYRRSLEYVAPMWDEDAKTRQNLLKWARLIREFGDPAWAADVEHISERAVMMTPTGTRRDRSMNSLLTAAELRDRIRQAFGDDYLDAPYIWDEEGERSGG